MLLALDIGNTNINIGIFKGRRLLKRLHIDASRKDCCDSLRAIATRNKIKHAVISSVVPQATVALRRCLKSALGRQPYIIGKELEVPVENLYRKPGQVGMDRLVNAYAGIELYGAPLVVVDFGTALTFDVISKGREYLGGMILPGLTLSLDALYQRTALLPQVLLKEPKEFIGKDTKSSMLSGIVYGFAALSDELTLKIKKVTGVNTRVIATGGNASLLAKYCRSFSVVDKDLTLKGINMLYLEGLS